MKVVLLPLKDPALAKQRLANRLSSHQRQQLTWAMLEDVTGALRAATTPDQVVVVSCCLPILRYAQQNSWQMIEEKSQISESHSVDRSCKLLRQSGASVVLRIPGDIPLLQAEDIDWLLSQELKPRSAILVPSRDGKGTNALLRRPPDAFPSHFGENSLALHQQEARRHGVELKILRNPRISFDLDKVSDILCFSELGDKTHTSRVLKQFDSLKRIPKME